MIEKYRFGKIKISGESYDYDVEVHGNGKVLKWWRKESHLIDSEDISRALEENPEMIIIGTGAAGIARITRQAEETIKEQGIELVVKKTAEAVKTFNLVFKKAKEKEGAKRVIGFFHLTC